MHFNSADHYCHQMIVWLTAHRSPAPDEPRSATPADALLMDASPPLYASMILSRSGERLQKVRYPHDRHEGAVVDASKVTDNASLRSGEKPVLAGSFLRHAALLWPITHGMSARREYLVYTVHSGSHAMTAGAQDCCNRRMDILLQSSATMPMTAASSTADISDSYGQVESR